MFNSARLTSIMFIIFAFVMTMNIPVQAKGKKNNNNNEGASVENSIAFEPGGNTIAGPGILNSPPGSTQHLYSSLEAHSIVLTLHCFSGNSAVNFYDEDDTLFSAISNLPPGRTDSVGGGGIAFVVLECRPDSPRDCDCLWRIDKP